MSKFKLCTCLLLILLFVGCSNNSEENTQRISSEQDNNNNNSDVQELNESSELEEIILSESEQMNIGKYLFNAEQMEQIEISGDALLSRKQIDMSVEIEKGKDMDFSIRRDDSGPGVAINMYTESNGIDLAGFYFGDKSLDEFCGARSGFYYQEACYDFDKDGKKEIVAVGGNKKNELDLYVFRVNWDKSLDYDNNPRLIASIHGGARSYVNDKSEICVIDDKNRVSVHPYNELELIETSNFIDKQYTKNNIKIVYPQMTNTDSALSIEINQKIREDALSILNKYSDKLDKVNLEINYKYMLDESRRILSIRYRGAEKLRGTEGSTTQFYASNIDLETGKTLDLSNVFDIDMDFVKELKEKAVIQGDNVRKNIVLEAEIEEQWEKYDVFRLYADLINKPLSDSKVSFYFKKSSLGISLKVNHELGDYVEFEVPYSKLE